MDEDLAAEIARLEAQLAQDNEARQAHGLPVPTAAPTTTAMSSSVNPFAPITTVNASMPMHQQQLQQQQQTATSMNPFANSFQPPPSSAAPTAVADHNAAKAAAAHTFTKDSDGRSIFIGNLPKTPAMTPEALAAFFADCGQILNCTVLKDRATQQLKGTAYIEFANYASMGQAIDTKHNALFMGSNIIVW